MTVRPIFECLSPAPKPRSDNLICLMPKSILIDPAQARQAGVLRGPDIPLNAYQPDPAAEAASYGRVALVRMYGDMVLIREFETMLDRIKKEGKHPQIATTTLTPHPITTSP